MTYSLKGDFGLPLAWHAFNDAFVKFMLQHDDEARALVLRTYADSMFPKGPGSDDLLFVPAADFRPRIILQGSDGTWARPCPSITKFACRPTGRSPPRRPRAYSSFIWFGRQQHPTMLSTRIPRRSWISY